MPKQTTKASLTKEESIIAAKALEILFASQFISKRQLYKENFIRGMFFSAGTIIGATLIVAFSAWVLSLFNEVPIVGPAVDTIQKSIESTKGQ